MHRRIRAALVTALTVAACAALAPAAMAENPVQLSLGDSWGYGYGAAVPSEGGYAARLNSALQQRFDCSPSDNFKPEQKCQKLELTNLSVPGAQTPDVIDDQLPQATSMLQSLNGNSNPRDNVEVVTLSTGGNDVVNPILGACLSGLNLTCAGVITSEFLAYQSDLNQALGTLRAAAGPDARIVIGTYDNGISQCYLGAVPNSGLLATVVLEGHPATPFAFGIHDIMRSVGAAHGVEVAEVYGDLSPGDWVGGGDCLHPNDSGYAKVAQAFVDVLSP